LKGTGPLMPGNQCLRTRLKAVKSVFWANVTFLRKHYMIRKLKKLLAFKRIILQV